MFTGFSSENIPAIKIWEYATSAASTSALRSVSLEDDCAPIQYFKTGGTFSSIRVYLPSCPIEGKQIKIVNAKLGTSTQTITLFSSDTNGGGSSTALYALRSGQTLDLCYSKNIINTNPFGGTSGSGWITLNQSPSVAINSYAVALGGQNNAADSVNSVVIGGTGNLSSNTSAGVFAGTSNTASGIYAGVLAGSSNTANGNSATVIGGTANGAGGLYSAVIGGNNNVSSQQNSFVIGGYSNTVTGDSSGAVGGSSNSITGGAGGSFGSTNSSTLAGNSIILGGTYGGNRFIQGHVSIPASYAPVAFTAGASQAGMLVLGAVTTNSTPKVLTSANYGGMTFDFNQLSLPSSQAAAYYFKGTVVAYINYGASKGWTFEGIMKTGLPSGFVGTPTITSGFSDAAASSWTVTLSFDSANRALAVSVVGASSDTVRWVCKLETTEVQF